MPPAGPHGDPQNPRDPRYDWLYGGGQGGQQDEATRAMPAGHGAGPYGAAPGPPPGQAPYRGDPYAQGPPGRDPYGPPGQPPPGQPPPGPAQHAPRMQPRRKPWGKIILALVLAYLAFLVLVPIIGWNRVEKVPFEPTDTERPAEGAGKNYLIVGSDRRDNLTAEEQSELGTGSSGGQRTDTIMLLHVPDNELPPTLVSLPRDSYVDLPGRDKNKINAAFSYGGPELLTATVENATDLRVDEYVEIGFGGFVGVTNAVGGVDMCLDEPLQDDMAHIDLKKGCQTLNGKEALGFVRARHALADGDLGRVDNQQKYMSALIDKAITPGTILNPVRYSRLSFSAGDALVAGKGTGVIDMARFALAMRAVSGGDGESVTVPIGNSGLSTPVGSAVEWDSDDASALFDALRTDQAVPPSILRDQEE